MRGLGIGILVTAIVMSISLHGRMKPMTDEEVIERAKELGMEETVGSGVLVAATTGTDGTTGTESEGQTDGRTTGTESEGQTDGQTTGTESEIQTAGQTTGTESEVQTAGKQTEDAQEQTAGEEPAEDTQEQTTGQTTGTESEDQTAGTESEDVQAQQDGTSEESADSSGKMEQDDRESGGIKQEDESDGSQIAEAGSEAAKQEVEPDTEAVKQIEITVNSGDGSLTVAKKLEQAGLIQDAKEYDRYLCQNGYDKKICTGVHTFEEGASDEEIAKEITRKAR